MMDRIIRSVEGHKLYHSIVAASEPGEEETPPHAVATATADLAEAVHAAAIVAYTASGTTAARVARKRPAVPILALTPNLATSRRLCLLWGAHSVCTDDVDSYEEMTAKACHTRQEEGFAKPNDIIVVTAGIPFHTAGQHQQHPPDAGLSLRRPPARNAARASPVETKAAPFWRETGGPTHEPDRTHRHQAPRQREPPHRPRRPERQHGDADRPPRDEDPG